MKNITTLIIVGAVMFAVGSFTIKANADAMLSKVKAAGFTDAFIKYSE